MNKWNVQNGIDFKRVCINENRFNRFSELLSFYETKTVLCREVTIDSKIKKNKNLVLLEIRRVYDRLNFFSRARNYRLFFRNRAWTFRVTIDSCTPRNFSKMSDRIRSEIQAKLENTLQKQCVSSTTIIHQPKNWGEKTVIVKSIYVHPIRTI